MQSYSQTFGDCSISDIIASVCNVKVQTPVYESMLDLDLILYALMGDTLNTRHLYAIKSKPSMAECVNISAKVNEHTLNAERPGVTDVKTANGLPLLK